jgi:hypothetical protein
MRERIMMMRKRLLIACGLGLLLLLGAVALATSVNLASAHPAASHVSNQLSSQSAAAATPESTAEQSSDQTSDPDANAACATDAQGNQTGDCQDSQNSSGPEDSAAGGSTK